MPKSSAPKESKFAEMCRKSRQMEANNSANGIVIEDDERATNIPEKDKEYDHHEDHPLGEIVQHRMVV